MKNILLLCYDIHPKKGGESAVAWNTLLSISHEYRVTVVTRPNNINDCIESVKLLEIKNVNFIGYDLPAPVVKLKKKFPFTIFIYCILWQYFFPIYFKKLLNDFDIVHSVNFVSDTIPVFIFKFNAKTIWGPISHHEPLPYNLSTKYNRLLSQFSMGFRYLIWFVFNFKNRNNKFDLILYSNLSVLRRFGNIDNGHYFSSTGVSSDNKLTLPKNKNLINILYVARFVPIKGWSVIYECIIFLSKLNLSHEIVFNLVGEGPELNKFKNMIMSLSITSNIKIHFHGKVDHEKLNDFYSDSDIYLCPSFEGGGIAVAEALSFSLPVVCFNNYGPGETVGHSYSSCVKYNYKSNDHYIDFCSEVLKLITDFKYRCFVSETSFNIYKSRLSWDVKSKQLLNIYNNLLR